MLAKIDLDVGPLGLRDLRDRGGDLLLRLRGARVRRVAEYAERPLPYQHVEPGLELRLPHASSLPRAEPAPPLLVRQAGQLARLLLRERHRCPSVLDAQPTERLALPLLCGFGPAHVPDGAGL